LPRPGHNNNTRNMPGQYFSSYVDLLKIKS